MSGLDSSADSAKTKEIFNAGRHRWLGQVARDAELPGSAMRVAVLLWDMMNSKKGGAWPSIGFIARELTMHRSTVIRAINALEERGRIRRRRGRRVGQSNFYTISFGKCSFEPQEETQDTCSEDGSRAATK